MRKTLLFCLPIVWAAGCASIAGLDSISEQACAPDCGADAHGDVGAGDSQGGGDGAGGDDASDGGGDAHGGGDGPVESACGALNTNNNCSACGDKCATPSTSQTKSSCSGPASGQGATCQYTCAKGFLDCNAKTKAPDLDGCECNAPGLTQADCCPAGACPDKHDNGLGQGNSVFYDCASGINSTSAKDACERYLAGADAGGSCTEYNMCGDAGAASLSWCSGPTTGDCICWFYAGAQKGDYLDPLQKGIPMPDQCYCKVSSGSWM